MSHSRKSPCGLALSAALFFVTADLLGAAEGDRYWVWFQDGTHATGKRLDNLYHPRQLPKLDGRPLLGSGSPARVIRDTSRSSSLSGPFVEMTNGDVLPGRAERVAGVNGELESRHAPRLLVQPDGGDHSGTDTAGGVAVHLDRVRRIVLQPQPEAEFQPGLVKFRSGRRINARTVRFSKDGIRALGGSGVFHAAFNDIAEVHIPDRDRLEGVLFDSLWQPPGPDHWLVRIRTTNGSQLTFRRAHMTIDGLSGENHNRRFAIMPAWSSGGLMVDRDSVVWWTFRRPDELPLSLLPVRQSDRKAGLHRWPWRRNRTVLGSALSTGPYASDLGVGTHSRSELTFQLPPQARAFTAVVGLDDAAGSGGCATCRVFVNEGRAAPLWQREFLKGGDSPVRFGPVGLSQAASLTLVTEFAHYGRPTGADPFDVRDHVDWLIPLVTVNLAAMDRPAGIMQRFAPQLSGWRPVELREQRISVRPWWSRRRQRWLTAIVPDAEKKIGEATPLEVTRPMQISLRNAFVYIAAGRDRGDETFHQISLLVDGEKQDTTLNGDLGTNAGPDDAHDRFWSLSQHVGKEAIVSLLLRPHGSSNSTPAGIIWQEIRFGPLIEDLPADGKPIEPDMPLESLTPIRVTGPKPDMAPGKIDGGSPLQIRGYPFEKGFGTRCNVTLTYDLDPAWRRLVAVVGLADDWQAVGPYEVLLDGKPHFETTNPRTFGRSTPGRQLDVPIPSGHKTITLRVRGPSSQAAWANAGFMLE
jgi:hypothetical protein